METVDKFGGEIELGQREKLVADYPEGEEENTDRYGRKHGISQEGDLEDYELEDRRMRMQFPVNPDEEIGTEDAECRYSDEEIDTEKSDLDKDGEISEYERKRGLAIAKAMKKEQKRAGQAHSRAVADHYEDEEDEQVAMSPQQINQHMINQYRQNLQSQYGHERRNRHGY